MSDRLFLRLPEDELHGPEAGPLPGGSLRAYVPSAALQPYASHILLYRETLAPGTELVERVVPDGSLRLVFNLGDAPSTGDGPGLVAGVLGASAAPALVKLKGRIHAFSVGLKPGAASALLGVPAGEFAEGHVTIDALWGRDGELLLERLAEARSDTARARIVQAALLDRLPAANDDAPARQAALALELIARNEGRTPLREVAQQLGCGERRLQQLFHTHVGLAPRTSRRLLRMQGCLRRLRGQASQAPAWASLADDCGFYDQSHLVNEFQALCGLTPTEYWRTARSGAFVAGSSKTAG